MILITGDTHCPIDIDKFSNRNLRTVVPDLNSLTKDDYAIICGDSGLVWYGRDKEDLYWQKWLNDKPFTTLFVDGNHDNHDKLDGMPIEEWNGGKIHRLKNSVIHLMRGEIYNINGYKFLALGGAESIDKFRRTEGKSWCAREMPSQEEYDNCRKNLAKNDYKADYIITHTCPISIIGELYTSHYIQTELTDFFEDISKEIEFKRWYFGHHHVSVGCSKGMTYILV